jgi:hypothetical protein
MGEFPFPVTDQHVCFTCHSCVNGIVTQKQAEGGIMGIGRHTSNGVTGIDLFEVNFHSPLFEIGSDFVSQKNPYITKTNVAGCIPLLGSSHKILTRTFSYYDNGMSLGLHSFFQGL